MVKMSLESDKALGFFKETLIRKTRQAALKARAECGLESLVPDAAFLEFIHEHWCST